MRVVHEQMKRKQGTTKRRLVHEPILLALVALMACVAAAIGAAGDSNATGARLAFQARVSDFRETVRVAGTIRAEKVTLITSPLSGKLIVALASEGEQVKKGDVIAQLDKAVLEESALDVKDAIISAEADVASARTALDKSKLDIESSMAELEAKLAVAEARLRFEESKPLPEERKAAEAEMARAQALLRYADYWLTATRRLSDEGVLSKHDLREAELAQQDAIRAEERASNALQETLAGAVAEDLEAARTELIAAQISFQEARDTKEKRIKQAEMALRSMQTSLDEQRKNLANIEEDLARTDIKAEHEGTVFAHPSEKATVGDYAWPGRTLLHLADTSSLILAAKVRECDSRLIQVGQSATVRLLAFRDGAISGKVSKVGGALAEEENAPGIRYLDVDVELAELPPGVRPGMSGLAEVEVNNVPNALVIPQCALRDDTVRVVVGSDYEDRQIDVLAADGTMVAVKSGLKEGEWTVLALESE